MKTLAVVFTCMAVCSASDVPQDRKLATNVNAPAIVRELRPVSSKVLSTPVFAYWGLPQSDEDGNLFFHTDVTGSYSSAVVLRLKHDSGDPTLFSLPADDEDKDEAEFVDFCVSPDGTVWFLSRGRSNGQTQIAQFGSDGKLRNQTTIDVPSGLFAEDFAVFKSGAVFLAGSLGGDVVPPSRKGKSFAGIFLPSGKLARDLSGEVPESEPRKQLSRTQPTPAHAGAAVVAADGNIYFLHSTTISVYSEGGELVKAIPFHTPESAYPVRMAVSAGYSVVWLNEVDRDNRIKRKYLVIDIGTGEELGLYRIPDGVGVGTTAAAYSRKDGFLLVGAKDGYVVLTRATL